MGRGRSQVLEDFIDDLPDAKLQYLPETPNTIYSDVNLRLDMQGITSNDEWNLQVQVNWKPKVSSLKPLAPKTVAGPVLVPRKKPLSPEEIRAALRDTRLF
ncbi:hypothetical protein LZ32DRAFT_601260 [Colletotrichum eremochloae]|nr:hypothetical protein LZ32DRAFT_601260 [Colletotrichum eremochloae]